MVGRSLRAVVMVVGCALLVACGAGTTTVLEPPESKVSVSAVSISRGKSTVTVPDDVVASFEKSLSTELYGKNDFSQGDALRISYRFIQFNPGDRFGRWFMGGIGNMGEASLSIEATYTDARGFKLGKIIVGGKIGSGFLGGSVEEAIEKAAEEMANYTKVTFR